MINFSKDSWHYNFLVNSTLNYTTEDEVRKNLCPYVRQLLAAFTMVTLTYAGVIFFGFCVLHAVVVNPIYIAIYGIEAFAILNNNVFLSVATALGFIVCCIAVFAITMLLAQEAWYKYRTSKHHKLKADKEPSVIVEYFKALHDKVCPQVTFTDKKGKE